MAVLAIELEKNSAAMHSFKVHICKIFHPTGLCQLANGIVRSVNMGCWSNVSHTYKMYSRFNKRRQRLKRRSEFTSFLCGDWYSSYEWVCTPRKLVKLCRCRFLTFLRRLRKWGLVLIPEWSPHELNTLLDEARFGSADITTYWCVPSYSSWYVDNMTFPRLANTERTAVHDQQFCFCFISLYF